MANYALISENTIQNVAIVDPTTADGKSYLEAVMPDYDEVVDVTTLQSVYDDQEPGPGWNAPGGPGTPFQPPGYEPPEED